MGLGKKAKAKAQIVKGKTKKNAGQGHRQQPAEGQGESRRGNREAQLKREKIKTPLKH